MSSIFYFQLRGFYGFEGIKVFLLTDKPSHSYPKSACLNKHKGGNHGYQTFNGRRKS